MSSLFSTFSCCFWWFLLGALVGWLLHHLFRGKLNTPSVQQVQAPTSIPAPAAAPIPAPIPAPKPAPKVAEPVISAPIAKTVEPVKPATPATPVSTTSMAIDLAAAKAAGFVLKNANDLTVVEGIGPKINELFNNASIKTFAQLAGASVPQMRKILDDGGPRFRIANPSTWAQQSALAAANKWTELKKMQDALSGGIKK